MVLDAGYTVTGLPVVTKVPPQLPVYQYTVPTAPLAVSIVPLGVQIVPGEADADVGSLGLLGGPGVEEPNVISSKAH